MRDQESMLWPVVAMLLGAALIVSLCMHPGLNWNWTAVGAIGSASAALAAVGIALSHAQEQKRGRRRSARAYAHGLRIKLPSIVDALDRFCDVLNCSDDTFSGSAPEDLELAYSLAQSIDVGILKVIDESLVAALTEGIQLISRARNAFAPELGMAINTLSDAACARTKLNTANNRLDKLLR